VDRHQVYNEAPRGLTFEVDASSKVDATGAVMDGDAPMKAIVTDNSQFILRNTRNWNTDVSPTAGHRSP